LIAPLPYRRYVRPSGFRKAAATKALTVRKTSVMRRMMTLAGMKTRKIRTIQEDREQRL
jgi:hypothetical protein